MCTGTLLLQKDICPQKSLPNLRQLIFGRLLKWAAHREWAASCSTQKHRKRPPVPGPAAIVSGQEPESRDAGVSRFAENGSHLAAADAAEGHAGQVGGSGSSGNAGIGSHLAAAGFSNDPGAFLCRRPHRAVQNQASCCTGRPRWAVRCRKWPCGVREARLSIGGCARRWQQEQVRHGRRYRSLHRAEDCRNTFHEDRGDGSRFHVPWLRRQAGRVLHHVLLLRCRIYFSMDDNEAPRAEV